MAEYTALHISRQRPQKESRTEPNITPLTIYGEFAP